MLGLLVPLMAFLRVPEPLRRLASGIALGAALIALLFVMWAFWGRAEREDDEANVAKGRSEERAERNEQAIEQVKEANNAREEIHDPASDARYNQCLRAARNPSNCRYLLPEREGNQPLRSPVSPD